MKRFLLKLIIFCCIPLIISFPIDNILSKNLRNNPSAFLGEIDIWNTIYSGKANADIAIYGSSRAWVQFNPEPIEKALDQTCFNYGIDGHNFWLQYLRHLEIIENNTWPKIIILSVDFGTLEKRKDLYNAEQFIPYIKRKNIKEFTKSYIGFNWYDYHLPLFRYLKYKSALNESISKVKNQHLRIKGYKGQEKKWNYDLKYAKSKLSSYNVNIDKASIALFDQFIYECKENNTNIILVYAPVYIEGQKFVKQREEVIKLFCEKAQINNIPFLNYTNDRISFDKSNFYNSMHLNKKGAELFSLQLAEDIKKLIL